MWPGSSPRQLDQLAEPELRIAGGGLAAGVVPAGEVRKEDAKGGSLERVEPRVRPDELDATCRASRGSAASDPLGDLVVESDEPAVAEANRSSSGRS